MLKLLLDCSVPTFPPVSVLSLPYSLCSFPTPPSPSSPHSLRPLPTPLLQSSPSHHLSCSPASSVAAVSFLQFAVLNSINVCSEFNSRSLLSFPFPISDTSQPISNLPSIHPQPSCNPPSTYLQPTYLQPISNPPCTYLQLTSSPPSTYLLPVFNPPLLAILVTSAQYRVLLFECSYPLLKSSCPSVNLSYSSILSFIQPPFPFHLHVFFL